MNKEKLISLVFERKSLWDMTDKKYHMRHIQLKLWSEVAEDMNNSVDEVKKKWRNLRDTFRKELLKHQKCRSGDGASARTFRNWPYFQQMMFLNNTRGQLEGNLSKENEINTEEENFLLEHNSEDQITVTEKPIKPENESAAESEIEHQIENAESLNLAVSKKCGSKKLKMTKRELKKFPEKFLEIEKKKLEVLQHNIYSGSDSDYQFLMSLVPYLQKVPENRKLIVRAKLQQIFIDEQHTPRPSSSYSSYSQTFSPTLIPSPGCNFEQKFSNN